MAAQPITINKIIASINISFAIALTASSASFAGTAESGMVRTVLTTPIHYTDYETTRTFAATIKPRVEVNQGFRVSGKIARRLVEVGQPVKAGTPLATLDEVDFRLQKEQAEAELSASQAVLSQATADEKRGDALRSKGLNPMSLYERQRAMLEEAKGRYQRARRAVELAAHALAYTTITADADGVVTATMIDPGQVIAAGQPAILIARKDQKEAAVAIPELYFQQARDGAATVTLWSTPNAIYQAALRELSPTADPLARTFAARYSLPNADERVALGMSATLTLVSAKGDRSARVPLSAVFDQGGGPGLWCVGADGSLALKPVKIQRYEHSEALIASGVEENDQIVALGVQKLDASQKVRPIAQVAY